MCALNDLHGPQPATTVEGARKTTQKRMLKENVCYQRATRTLVRGASLDCCSPYHESIGKMNKGTEAI